MMLSKKGKKLNYLRLIRELLKIMKELLEIMSSLIRLLKML
jgi:hypothetical protein|tara:strand:+ start:3821 stop:3943 length:123 start_codon:yes stop_codon:yes gene_type:complete